MRLLHALICVFLFLGASCCSRQYRVQCDIDNCAICLGEDSHEFNDPRALYQAYCTVIGISDTSGLMKRIEDCRKSMDDSLFTVTCIDIGDTLFKQNKLSQSLLFFKSAEMVSPKLPLLAMNLGLVYFELGIDSLAQHYLMSSIRQNRDCYVCWYTLGNILIRAGDFERAKNCLKMGKDISLDSEYYRLMGQLFEKRELYDIALSYLDTGIVKYPKESMLYTTRGLLKLNLFKENEAVEDFKSALSMDSTSIYNFYNLALGYAYLHDSENACLNYQLYLTTAGEHPMGPINFDSLCD